jgi:hypothetical protein
VTNPAGETQDGILRPDFDRRVLIQFRGSVVTSDAGLLAYRELDDAFELTPAAADLLADSRTEKNGRKPIAARYQGTVEGIAFRGDAAFAQPNMYEFLEVQGIDYAIRLPANQILQARIGHLLTRPVGRAAHYVQRFYKSFHYKAASWSRPRRVVAEVEWHLGELFPRIKEWKCALKGTRLSCRSFKANAVRLHLHVLAYNLGNFLRALATPEAIAEWSLTSLRKKLIKIGAKVVSHGRYVTFQMAEVAIPRRLFAEIMQRIAALRSPPLATAT